MSQRVIEWGSEQQRWLVERGAAPTMLVGGVNSGKTTGCILKMLGLLQKYPGSRAALIRRTYTQLLNTLMESWYIWCTPEFYRPLGSRNDNAGELVLNNGSKVHFMHLDKPDSLDALAGLELNFGYVSQAEEISKRAWDILETRCGRWTGATIPESDFEAMGGRDKWPWTDATKTVCVPPPYLFGEAYATDETHWIYDRFHEDSPNRAQYRDLGYEMRIVDSREHKFAIQSNIRTALAKGSEFVDRFVAAKFGNPEGAIFRVDPLSELPYSPALIDRIKRMMKHHRSMDHGDTAPTAILNFAIDHDGNVFVWREYYVPNALTSAHRAALFVLDKDNPFHYHSQLADPQIFAKSRGRSATKGPEWAIADEWSDVRVQPAHTAIRWQPWAVGPTEAVDAARMLRLKEYLRVDPDRRHPITGELGAPRIYFIKRGPDWPNGCYEVLRELKAQRRQKVKVGDREIWTDERDDSVVDHAYDALAGFVFSRPSLGETPKAPDVPGRIPIAAFAEANREQRVRLGRLARAAAPVGNWG